MREKQLSLEKTYMAETSISSKVKMFSLLAEDSDIVRTSSKVEEAIKDHHDSVKRKRSPFFKITKDASYLEVADCAVTYFFTDFMDKDTTTFTKICTDLGALLWKSFYDAETVNSQDHNDIRSMAIAGGVLAGLLINKLGKEYFSLQLNRVGDKTVYMVKSGDAYKKFFEDNKETLSIISCDTMPMVCVPDKWTNVKDGGYLSKKVKKAFPLVKRRPYHEEPEGPFLFSGINAMQSTPYRVNKRILAVAEQLETIRPAEMKKVFLPDLGEFTEECPLDRDADSYLWEKVEHEEITKSGKVKVVKKLKHTDEESKEKRSQFFAWVARRDLHKKRMTARDSISVSYTQAVKMAKMFENDVLYWPMSTDRRMRIYPMAMTGLNIQGADYQKGLIEFASGLPLDYDGDGEGAVYAIKKTLCNHWGNDSGNGVKTDKLTRKQAEEWIETASEWICDQVKDPINNRLWMKADKPFQFLAAAQEWVDWLDYWEQNGDYGFISHLCDPNDASCSGAQILSAMTKDPIGALYTNLMDREVQDLYLAVADKVLENLWALLKDPDNESMAYDWLGGKVLEKAVQDVLEHGHTDLLDDKTINRVVELAGEGYNIKNLSRKLLPELDKLNFGKVSLIVRNLVKKPVMVKFYSGTRYGNMVHCKDFITENHWEGLFTEDIGKAATMMGNLIYDSINQVIVGAGKVMDWFVHVAEVFGENNLPVRWTNLAGFKGIMSKPKEEPIRAKVPVEGHKKPLRINIQVPKYVGEGVEKTLELNTASMKSGIAPDLVHSTDASLVALVGDRAKQEGIEDTTMIHDSLGSHCCFSTRFNRIIREVFVSMFSGDVLGDLYRQFKEQLPEDSPITLLSPKEFGIEYGDFDLTEMLNSEFCFK